MTWWHLFLKTLLKWAPHKKSPSGAEFLGQHINLLLLKTPYTDERTLCFSQVMLKYLRTSVRHYLNKKRDSSRRAWSRGLALANRYNKDSHRSRHVGAIYIYIVYLYFVTYLFFTGFFSPSSPHAHVLLPIVSAKNPVTVPPPPPPTPRSSCGSASSFRLRPAAAAAAAHAPPSCEPSRRHRPRPTPFPHRHHPRPRPVPTLPFRHHRPPPTPYRRPRRPFLRQRQPRRRQTVGGCARSAMVVVPQWCPQTTSVSSTAHRQL
jgi:hypothetical protein